jgi:hypothetical protein
MKSGVENRNEKIIKALIIVGVMMILISLSLKYYKPVIAGITEIMRQREDKVRIEDISLIDAELNELKKHDFASFLGEGNKVYISLSSSSVDCNDLDLPSLSEGWEYRCKTEKDYKKIDGSGWIPVDISKLKDNKLKELPIDPINSVADISYYVFVMNNSGDNISWVLTAPMGSKKHIKANAVTDNGTGPMRFNIGNISNLWSEANGLVGYWNFNKNEDDMAKDSSRSGNDGMLIDNPEWVYGKIGQAYLFNGKNKFVEIDNSESIDIKKSMTIEAWVKPLDSTQRIMGKYNADSSGGWYLWFSPERKFVFSVTDGYEYASVESKKSYETAEWSHVVGQYDDETKLISLFVNGEKISETTLLRGTTQSTSNLTIGKFTDGGDGFFDGVIDEVHLYNRLLSEKEIQKYYLLSL